MRNPQYDHIISRIISEPPKDEGGEEGVRQLAAPLSVEDIAEAQDQLRRGPFWKAVSEKHRHLIDGWLEKIRIERLN